MKAKDLMKLVSNLKTSYYEEVNKIKSDEKISDKLKRTRLEELEEKYNAELKNLNDGVESAFSELRAARKKTSHSVDLLSDRFLHALNLIQILGADISDDSRNAIIAEFGKDSNALKMLRKKAEDAHALEFATQLDESLNNLPTPRNYYLLEDKAYYETLSLNTITNADEWNAELSEEEDNAVSPDDSDNEE